MIKIKKCKNDKRKQHRVKHDFWVGKVAQKSNFDQKN